MPRPLSIALRILLVAACLVYAFWGVDAALLGAALTRYDPLLLLGALVYSFGQYMLLGVRLNFLTQKRGGFLTCLKASVFGLGVNNLLPAKLGEVAKAFYLRTKAGIPLGQGLGLVFWERFMDVNFLLAAALTATACMGLKLAVVPLAVMAGGIWACLLGVRLFPGLAYGLTRLLPGKRLRELASEVLLQLQAKRHPGFFPLLALYSAAIWTAYSGLFHLVFIELAGLPLSFGQVITAFIIATFGFAMPSSPGGLGVFEAAIVLALGLFQVPKEEALAVGIVLRAIQYIPPTLAALYLMASSGLSAKTLRETSQNLQEPPCPRAS